MAKKKKETQLELLFAAANALVNAYRDGSRNEQIEWEDIDVAARFASKATGRALDPDEDV